MVWSRSCFGLMCILIFFLLLDAGIHLYIFHVFFIPLPQQYKQAHICMCTHVPKHPPPPPPPTHTPKITHIKAHEYQRAHTTAWHTSYCTQPPNTNMKAHMHTPTVDTHHAHILAWAHPFTNTHKQTHSSPAHFPISLSLTHTHALTLPPTHTLKTMMLQHDDSLWWLPAHQETLPGLFTHTPPPTLLSLSLSLSHTNPPNPSTDWRQQCRNKRPCTNSSYILLTSSQIPPPHPHNWR